MKKSVTLKIKDKSYTLEFNVKKLAQLERSLGGRSLTYLLELVNANPTIYANIFTIDFVKNALEAGIVNQPDNFDGYDFIDQYCQNDSLSELTSQVLKAIYITGLFIKGPADEARKVIEDLSKLGA